MNEYWQLTFKKTDLYEQLTVNIWLMLKINLWLNWQRTVINIWLLQLNGKINKWLRPVPGRLWNETRDGESWEMFENAQRIRKETLFNTKWGTWKSWNLGMS